jgi:hypothetical protein
MKDNVPVPVQLAVYGMLSRQEGEQGSSSGPPANNNNVVATTTNYRYIVEVYHQLAMGKPSVTFSVSDPHRFFADPCGSGSGSETLVTLHNRAKHTIEQVFQ